MMELSKKIGLIALMFIFVIVAAFTLSAVVSGIDPVYAELSSAKKVALSGVNYSDALGNTTGAFRGEKVSNTEFPDEINCFFNLVNSAGTMSTNTASIAIETSIDDQVYDVFQNVTVAASVVTGIRNTGGTGTPFGNYWRVNISAIQNANASFLRARCLME